MVCLRAPVVDAVISCRVQVFDCVFEPVVVVLMWVGVGLQKLDAGKCDVWAACCHGPDELADACSVVELHGFREQQLVLGIVGSDGGVEFLEPDWTCWEWYACFLLLSCYQATSQRTFCRTC